MPAAITPILLLAALDQLIIRRETNLTRMEEQLEELDATMAEREAIEAAVILTKAALKRLAKRRAQVVTRIL